MKYSLVIPCYNEANSIPTILDRCQDIARDYDFELIIVNNGSQDETQKVLSNYLETKFLKIVNIKVNKGYGNGILEGLKEATGNILSWTHADLQTDPYDFINAIKTFEEIENPEKIFVKGRRFGRPFSDSFFTFFMSIFESILLQTRMSDINAQPNAFHRSFYETWENPPKDFSLDLFVYYAARKNMLKVIKFPVLFGDRRYGHSSWNISFASKYRFIKRTIKFSFELKRRFR